MKQLWNKYRGPLLLAAGAASLVGGLLVVRADLVKIGQSHPDILYGPLFALAGALFSLALRPSQEQKVENEARLLLQQKRTFSPVLAQDIGLLSALSLVERDLDAAIARLNEYYDGRTTGDDFHIEKPQLLVVAQDLDHCRAEVSALRTLVEEQFLGEDPAVRKEKMDAEQRTTLESALRDLTEAYNRRSDALESLRESKDYGEVKDMFRVMSSDMAKGHKTLTELLSLSQRTTGLASHIRLIGQYTDVAIERSVAVARMLDQQIGFRFADLITKTDAAEVEQLSKALQEASKEEASREEASRIPPTFGVMLADLLEARGKFREALKPKR